MSSAVGDAGEDRSSGPSGWRSRVASLEAAAVAGIVCAIGWSVGLGGLLSIPSLSASDAEIVRYYRQPNAGENALLLLQIVVVASIAFLWFVGVVRGRLGADEPRLAGTVFLGGSVLLAGIMFVGTAALAAPSVLLAVGGRFPDPGAASMARAFAATVLAVFGPRVTALVMISTASLGRTTGALPRWLVALSYLLGVIELVNVTLSQPSLYVFPAWLALVSVVLLIRRPRRSLEPEVSG
jgi:hypothetical protein